MLKPGSFPPNCELRIPTSRNPNQNRAALWRIFSSNKSAPANRKTGFYANRDPNKQEVGFVFARTLKSFQIFKSEIKKLKTYRDWCPFQGLSNGNTFMQIQSGRTVPLNYIYIRWFTDASAQRFQFDFCFSLALLLILFGLFLSLFNLDGFHLQIFALN